MVKTYTKGVSEPWFTLIKLGIKNVEGRLNKGDFAEMMPDDVIIFTNADFGAERKVRAKIVEINEYVSFHDYLRSEKLSKCLPGIDDLKSGVAVYRKYYSEIDEKKYGIAAIRVKVSK